MPNPDLNTIQGRNEADAQRDEMELQNPRIKLFIKYYLESLNEGKAAERAGMARSHGRTLLQRPPIRAEIEKGLGLVHMSAAEIIARLSVFARATMEDFLDDSGLIDLNKARELQVLGVVKKIKYDSRGMPEIELENRQDAMEKLGKILGMFVERMQIDSSQVIDINVNRKVMAAAMADPLTIGKLIEVAELIRGGGRGTVDVAAVSTEQLPAGTAPVVEPPLEAGAQSSRGEP